MVEIAIEPETPSKAVTAQALKTATVVDSGGRTIVIKRMSILERMRLFEIIGGELVGNAPYFGWAILACMVVSIDGDPVSRPTSKLELEALVQRLDDAGLIAVGAGAEEHLVDAPAADLRASAKNV